MRWSHLFGSTIRNRGFLYYKNGHVEKVDVYKRQPSLAAPML